jgi:glycosyltransferase domain-containing protein
VAKPLEDLTVIIPTISRPLFVRRQVEYWSEFEARVVILDGASTSIRDQLPNNLPPHVQYVHFPVRFNERLSRAGEFVTTEFACLLPDDEFFVPQGLSRAIERLREDNEVIGVVGKVLYFFVDQERFLCKRGYEDWKNFSESATRAIDRVEECLPPNKAHKVQFGVFRSTEWKKIFTQCYADFYSCGYLYERMLNLYSAVLGKTVVIDELLWMRSMENPPISNDAVPRDDRGGMLGWADDPLMRHEVEHYLKKVDGLISKGEGISRVEAGEAAHRFVYGGFEKHRAKIEASQSRHWPRVAKRLMNACPKSVRLWAKRSLPSGVLRGFDWSGYSIVAIAEQLKDRKVGFCLRDLERIERYALKTDLEARKLAKSDKSSRNFLAMLLRKL